MSTTEIKNRYDFVMLFDVQDGNPNGDPDAGNLPRVDPENGMGIVSDVCLKRKIRNYVQVRKDLKAPFDIFVKEKAILNNAIAEAHADTEVKKKEKGEKTDAARVFMCKKFYDIRTFGAVLSTGENAGQVRGPVQLTFARSIDRVMPNEHCITRMAVATEKEADNQKGENRTMGRKFTIPYGLYRAHGFVSAHLANQTQFSQEDLDLLWESIVNMFEHDRSAARGLMSLRKLIIFKHNSALGDCSSTQCFDRIAITRKNNSDGPARSFEDYEVTLDSKNDALKEIKIEVAAKK